MENLQKFIAGQLKMLERGFIATPNTMEDLEAFAKSNHGSSDMLLMQMAMNFGYKLALEGMKEELEKELEVLEGVKESLATSEDVFHAILEEVQERHYDWGLEAQMEEANRLFVERGFVEDENLGFILKED